MNLTRDQWRDLFLAVRRLHDSDEIPIYDHKSHLYYDESANDEYYRYMSGYKSQKVKGSFFILKSSYGIMDLTMNDLDYRVKYWNQKLYIKYDNLQYKITFEADGEFDNIRLYFSGVNPITISNEVGVALNFTNEDWANLYHDVNHHDESRFNHEYWMLSLSGFPNLEWKTTNILKWLIKTKSNKLVLTDGGNKYKAYFDSDGDLQWMKIYYRSYVPITVTFYQY